MGVNIRWHSPYKQLQFFFILSAFVLYLFSAFVLEIMQLNEEHYLRNQLRDETALYMRSDFLEESELNGYINDNQEIVDMSLRVLLESAYVKLLSSGVDKGAEEKTFNTLVGYREMPNNIEVYAIKKEDLFKSIKYRYILDEFTESPDVSYISVDTKQNNNLIITKRIAYVYYKAWDVIVVAEKTLDPEFSDRDNVMEKLHTYSLVTNSDTMGSIVVFDKTGKILSDNHRLFEGKGLDVKDIYTETSIKDLLLNGDDRFVEFTLQGDRESSKIAFITYSETMERYYMDAVKKSVINEKASEYHKNLLRMIVGFIVINLLLMGYSAYKYTKKLLE